MHNMHNMMNMCIVSVWLINVATSNDCGEVYLFINYEYT